MPDLAQGMGKTVELLACLLAHPFPGPKVPPSLVTPRACLPCPGPALSHVSHPATSGGSRARERGCADSACAGRRQVKPEAEEAPKQERVDCICGVRGELGSRTEAGYEGLWVQCDTCAAWLHGKCVGLSRAPRGGEGESSCVCTPLL